jgi:hypothetical protein
MDTPKIDIDKSDDVFVATQTIAKEGGEGGKKNGDEEERDGAAEGPPFTLVDACPDAENDSNAGNDTATISLGSYWLADEVWRSGIGNAWPTHAVNSVFEVLTGSMFLVPRLASTDGQQQLPRPLVEIVCEYFCPRYCRTRARDLLAASLRRAHGDTCLVVGRRLLSSRAMEAHTTMETHRTMETHNGCDAIGRGPLGATRTTNDSAT